MNFKILKSVNSLNLCGCVDCLIIVNELINALIVNTKGYLRSVKDHGFFCLFVCLFLFFSN